MKNTSGKPASLAHYIKAFIRDSRSVGIVLIACTIISLFLTNSPFGEGYLSFWETPMTSPFQGITIPKDLTGFIDDALMAFFFLLVGLEIKRELVAGELSNVKKAALPIFAAIGGMLMPAGIYALWNINGAFSHGWGIPMATDIAFSIGILSLLGKRVPLSLKILLTALAIIDDLGAVVAIAIFYTAQLHWLYLVIGLGLTALLVLFNLLKVKRLFPYFIIAAALWYCLFNSGIHPTIAGVVLAFTIPLEKIPRLEKILNDPVNFIILPLFALVNTAILFPNHFDTIVDSTVTYGILMGLVFGKPLGILCISFIVVKIKLAQLPDDLKWKDILGLGMMAGIGFTMSIFIANLAFTHPEATVISKISIIAASVISGTVGFIYLKRRFRSQKD